MLKRKPSFYAYWLPIAAVGFLPLALSQTAHAAKTDSGAPSTQTEKAPPPYLSLEQAKSAIPTLALTKIKSGDSTVVKLTGLYPHACIGTFKIVSTSLRSDVASSDGVEGFAIQDTGGFADCVKKNGVCGEGDVCESLSLAKPDPELVLDGSKTVSVAYLDHQIHDVALHDNWKAAGAKPLLIKSNAEKEQEKEAAAARAKALELEKKQQEILVCASSKSGIRDARHILARAGFDEQTAHELEVKIDAYQKKFDEQDAQELAQKVKDAVDNEKTDQFGDLEEQIYAFASAHPNQGDRMAGLIYQMAQTLASSDNATLASIDRGQAMLERALDYDTGLKMSAKSRQVFNDAKSAGGAFDNARLTVEYSNFETLRDKAPRDWSGRSYREEGKAYAEYMKSANKIDKTLRAQYKHMDCITRWGMPSEKRQKNKAVDKACGELEDRMAAIERPNPGMPESANNMSSFERSQEQQHYTAMQQAQQSAVASQMPPQGMMAAPGAPQQAPNGMMPTQGVAGQIPGVVGGQYLPGFAPPGQQYSMPQMGAPMTGMPVMGQAAPQGAMNGIPTTSAGGYVPYYYHL